VTISVEPRGAREYGVAVRGEEEKRTKFTLLAESRFLAQWTTLDVDDCRERESFRHQQKQYQRVDEL